jgi:hypothetical protein
MSRLFGRHGRAEKPALAMGRTRSDLKGFGGVRQPIKWPISGLNKGIPHIMKNLIYNEFINNPKKLSITYP